MDPRALTPPRRMRGIDGRRGYGLRGPTFPDSGTRQQHDRERRAERGILIGIVSRFQRNGGVLIDQPPPWRETREPHVQVAAGVRTATVFERASRFTSLLAMCSRWVTDRASGSISQPPRNRQPRTDANRLPDASRFRARTTGRGELIPHQSAQSAATYRGNGRKPPARYHLRERESEPLGQTQPGRDIIRNGIAAEENWNEIDQLRIRQPQPRAAS